MIFYFLITIVFIAEIIIAVFLLSHLAKWSKAFREISIFIYEINPKIKEIMKIGTQISEQMPEMASVYVEKIKIVSAELLLSNLKGFLAGMLMIFLKKKIKLKRIRGIFRIIRLFCID